MLSLPEDIIWRIVVMISFTTEQKQLLRHIRHLSQICRNWRSVAITTSTIWGRAIDMDVLGASSRYWSYEVIRRSGNSPLHVYGAVYGNRRRSNDLLTSLLKHHWSRFEVLDIEVFNREDLSVWDTFCKEPAPSLESFRLSCYGQGHIPDSFKVSLFSDHAPKLRRLRFEWDGQRHNFYHSKWTKQLREIELTAPLSVPQGLDLLAKMRDLEVLTISTEIFCLTSPLPSSQIKIVLPKLRSIAISGTLGTAIAFLSHITPSETWCTLRILTLPGAFQPASYPVSPSDMDRLESILTTYSHSILTSETLPRTSKSISMNLDDGHYAFFTSDAGTANESASIDIHHSVEPHLQFNIDTLSRVLLPCPLDIITYFRFVLSKPAEENIRLLRNPQLTTFIASLSSVRIIVLSVHSLEILYTNSQTREEPVFPELIEIRLTPTDQSLLKGALQQIISIVTSRQRRNNLRRVERLRLYGTLRIREKYLWIMDKLNDTEVTWH